MQLKRVWQKQDKQDNLEEDKEDKRIQTRQYKEDKKDKKDNLKQDKDELELDLWMLQLHAEGDGNSVRAFSNDICSVVDFYAMLCKQIKVNKNSCIAECNYGRLIVLAFLYSSRKSGHLVSWQKYNCL